LWCDLWDDAAVYDGDVIFTYTHRCAWLARVCLWLGCICLFWCVVWDDEGVCR
jgi:hypothetical protein